MAQQHGKGPLITSEMIFGWSYCLTVVFLQEESFLCVMSSVI